MSLSRSASAGSYNLRNYGDPVEPEANASPKPNGNSHRNSPLAGPQLLKKRVCGEKKKAEKKKSV
jgi:hypothetical protein